MSNDTIQRLQKKNNPTWEACSATLLEKGLSLGCLFNVSSKQLAKQILPWCGETSRPLCDNGRCQHCASSPPCRAAFLHTGESSLPPKTSVLLGLWTLLQSWGWCEVSVNPEKQVNICQSQLTLLITSMVICVRQLEGSWQAQRGALLIYWTTLGGG